MRMTKIGGTRPKSLCWGGHSLCWEGQLLGLLVILTMGLLGGLLSRAIGFNTGVQFMGYYTAVLTVPAVIKAFG